MNISKISQSNGKDPVSLIDFTDDQRKAYLNIIEGTMKTPPLVAIIPLQDYLGLTDDKGRMNIPSTLGCNWRWRCKREDYSSELAAYIKRITIESNRL